MITNLADIKVIAVLGAGTMGQGIAQVCGMAGFKTILFDISPEALTKGKKALQSSIDVAFEKKKLSPEQKEICEKNISWVSSVEEVRADFVIEAVVEKLSIKQELFRKLEDINGGNAILATNTSSLSVSAIAAELRFPERLMGVHFFNPAPLMKLVEIVAGQKTNARLIDVAKELLEKLQKTSVMSTDSPGFIVNRVARHYYLESLKLAEEKVCDIEGIDRLMQSSGFKMGPFRLMDLIGIDINYAVSVSVYNGFYQNRRFKPSEIQQQKVDAGLLGRKSGKGFYEY